MTDDGRTDKNRVVNMIMKKLQAKVWLVLVIAGVLVAVGGGTSVLLAMTGSPQQPTNGQEPTNTQAQVAVSPVDALVGDLRQQGVDLRNVAFDALDSTRLNFVVTKEVSGPDPFFDQLILRRTLLAIKQGAPVKSVLVTVVDENGARTHEYGWSAADLAEYSDKINWNVPATAAGDARAQVAGKLQTLDLAPGLVLGTISVSDDNSCRTVGVQVLADVAAGNERVVPMTAFRIERAVEEANSTELQLEAVRIEVLDDKQVFLLRARLDLELQLNTSTWLNEHFMPGWLSGPGREPTTTTSN